MLAESQLRLGQQEVDEGALRTEVFEENKFSRHSTEAIPSSRRRYLLSLSYKKAPVRGVACSSRRLKGTTRG